MTKRDRPLSPHIQIYKMPFTAVLSISHRITGVVMAVGTAVLAYWLVAAASGPDSFATAQAVLGSVPGRILLFGWSLALFYHLCNGIRHMFWDAGLGFEIRDAQRSGLATVAAALVLTALAWTIGF
ncbi:succinate dehydrogenase, cytochrome b556 subunit [Phaeospirillum tilakii]|jgi:succinate dehydrogenase / fumarate reductase cytochrome b subunit|uniref:Succinate dehydrogenase cytochrome b556 subunit n=1 Tax=Phaeospirillum tilakii TaxID=741673 RepID=A0ABW5CBQ7_9PROT